MGRELEIKLAVDGEAALERILADDTIAALVDGPWQERLMKTTYYDSPDRRFSSHFWTLRHRMEGKNSVVCVKAPTEDPRVRGEWQISAAEINEESIEALMKSGAPMELLYLYGAGDVQPVCGAEFTRKSVMLHFSDGSRAELAGDHGILHGKNKQLPFAELEIELYEGAPTEMEALAAMLQTRYGLKHQNKSKFARARALI